ncbi:MAG: NAD-dependent epimerase/dehydratase family protein [Synergistaceae bacterium]|nr:NAD-dependent epimerase/dehydratase family protein [Synergistaceae bacterium]
MKRIIVTGSLGQIGTELVVYLRKIYGADNVLATGRRLKDPNNIAVTSGEFQILNVGNPKEISEICAKYKADTVIHLAGVLSANAEKDPAIAWDTNMIGLYNVLEVARELKLAVFFPSSIAAFGPSTPADHTPQDTLQRPTTMYGVTKVAGELLSDYYALRFGVDVRGLRFPGIISYEAEPGGGTTDYAVHIYWDAIRKAAYTSYIAKGTFMDMMYMPDALDAVVKLMEADPAKLKHRNCFNITAMSFDPEQLADSIRKYIPELKLDYDVDPVRQGIANSWPNSLDDSCARAEWGYDPKYDLDAMTKDMLEKIKIKLGK